MYVESGTEAAQFPEKEFINGVFFALYIASHSHLPLAALVRALDAPGPAVFLLSSSRAPQWWPGTSALLFLPATTKSASQSMLLYRHINLSMYNM
jgi:hypothetical protein